MTGESWYVTRKRCDVIRKGGVTRKGRKARKGRGRAGNLGEMVRRGGCSLVRVTMAGAGEGALRAHVV